MTINILTKVDSHQDHQVQLIITTDIKEQKNEDGILYKRQ